MPLKVEFITLGDASEYLETPSPTLRHWTDQLEELNCHYVKRNNRNERIYYESDLKVFAFLRDLKAEYGRRTTTKDLAYMLSEKAEQGEFELRTREDAPAPKTPSNKTSELLGQEDIKRLMESDRVKQFMRIIIDENNRVLRENLKEEIREEIRLEMQTVNQTTKDTYKELQQELEKKDKQMEERLKKRDEALEERDKLMMEYIKERQEEKSKGFFSKLFGK